MNSKMPTAEQIVQALREMRGIENETQTGDRAWDRITSQCPKCRTPYAPRGPSHESCGTCGFTYEDHLQLLDYLYLKINVLGGGPFDGPYNTAITDVLNVLADAGAIDVETERR